MEREPQGGSDFGQDLARDAGEETGALRDAAPDLRAPIDESAPVSGHVVGPASSGSIAETPSTTGRPPSGSSSRPSGRSGRRA
jgi:hypothetical protein